MANKETTALIAQNNEGYLALGNSDFTADISSELNGLEIAFEKIKIPSGGAVMFEVPGEDDDVDNVKEFSAVILHHNPVCMFYRAKYTGGSTPPDCGSFDGIIGTGDPGGVCANCPNNQYGTGENGSKACKNRQRMYLLREGELFPMILSLPPGSLKMLSKYVTSQLSKGRKVSQIVTRFSLKKATNTSGIQFSQAQFKFDRKLTADEIALVSTMAAQVKAYANRAGYDAQQDVEGEIDIDFDVPPLNGGQ